MEQTIKAFDPKTVGEHPIPETAARDACAYVDIPGRVTFAIYLTLDYAAGQAPEDLEQEASNIATDVADAWDSASGRWSPKADRQDVTVYACRQASQAPEPGHHPEGCACSGCDPAILAGQRDLDVLAQYAAGRA